MTVSNQNCIHEEITSRLSSGTAGNHLVQNLLSSPEVQMLKYTQP
jgi:hypothetical protein